MTLAEKIEVQRRQRKYREIIRRMRLRYFEYEDAGKGDKAAALIEKIKANVLKPCPY